MSEQIIKQKGGARSGAGRPKGSVTGRAVLQTTSVQLSQDALNKVDQEQAAHGYRSRSAAINALILGANHHDDPEATGWA